MAKRPKLNEKVEMKTYILEVGSERRKKKVTVPGNWKITYGHACPGSTHNPGPMCVRFYEGNKDNLRAVFEDVVSFRDSTIKIEEQVIRRKMEVFRRDTPSGTKAVEAEMRVKQWRNPDDPQSDEEEDREYLAKLPAHSETED